MANAKTQQKPHYIQAADLPLCCPTPAMTLWNEHPRVYLPLQEKGEAICPYCGNHYILQG